MRDIPAGHRLEMLSLPTQPRPAAGALEAFACSAQAWLDRSLVREDPSRRGAGGPSSHVSKGLVDLAPGPSGSSRSTTPA
jgi:hypothetical protein